MRPDVFYFVSDGDPSGATPDKILGQVQKQQATGKAAVIHAIAYLADGGQRFMRDLAERNGGKFRKVNPSDLK